MKKGKYVIWFLGMIALVLSILVTLIALFINPVIGLIVLILSAIYLYGLFMFQNWWRICYTIYAAISISWGLVTSSLGFGVLITLGLLYLMWLDPDVSKLYTKRRRR